MQPYFFPYIGYFQLIRNCDCFVVFDSVQYIKQGWINRNRVLHQADGVQFINIPVQRHPFGTKIRDITIYNKSLSCDKICRQIEHYKKKSPYYDVVIEFLRNCFSFETNYISEFNVHLLEKTCEFIGIPFPCRLYSTLPSGSAGDDNSADDWGLHVSRELGADTYINAPGGIEFFNRSKYTDAGVEIKFIKPVLSPYDQKREAFEPGLSIIDVMMFNSPDEIKKMLDNYEII